MLDLTHIDHESLEKGSVIPAEVLERVTGLSRHNEFYSRELMKVCEHLREWFLKEREEPIVPVTRRYEIRLLQNEEVDAYKAQLRKRRDRQERRDLVDLQGVDASEFTKEQREKHEREIIHASYRLQAMKEVAKKMRPDPVRREVPTLQ